MVHWFKYICVCVYVHVYINIFHQYLLQKAWRIVETQQQAKQAYPLLSWAYNVESKKVKQKTKKKKNKHNCFTAFEGHKTAYSNFKNTIGQGWPELLQLGWAANACLWWGDTSNGNNNQKTSYSQT